MKQKKVLVFGATGLLGSYFSELVSATNPVFEFLYTSTSLEDSKQKIVSCNITDFEQVRALFEAFQPDIVVNFAALTSVDFCENEKGLCWKINYLAVQNIVSLSEKFNSFLLHASTDFVYDGTKQEYFETDIPNPLNFYGWSKFASEKTILHSKIRSAIVRTSLVYGKNPEVTNRNNILTWVVYSLRKKEHLKIINDQFRCPTFAYDLALGCLKIIQQEKGGVYHLCGSDRVSILDFVKKVIEIFELDKGLITAIDSISLSQPAVRPQRTYLNIDKAQKELPFEPMPLSTSLNLLKDLI